ncbi:MAG TPA: FtsW/RodA/SpoVE family cell cycle protein, partial [Bryobacteraceae bacterium]|nr:FtsW/RodA/SpoVE family cell cycle protein [Bryobacteraceae bacterium]
MAVTRSRAAERKTVRKGPARRWAWRGRELVGLAAAGLVAAFGLYRVYQTKAPELAAAEQQIAAGKLINLNELGAREDLLPALGFVSSQKDRDETARKIYYLSGGLPNVGAIRSAVTADQFRILKPELVVRRPAQFRSSFRLWVVLFFAAFLAAHIWLSLRRSRGDPYLLPATMLISCIGLVLMVSLRDPLRDQMLFAGFAEGVVGGCILLAALSGLDFKRSFGKLSFLPLLASLVLSALLIVLGHGPGTSDAKVNLFGFQPVEIIRLLLIFFLAGYFGSRWDVLRHARETRPSMTRLTRHFDIPPLEYTLPVLACVALSLLFFFLQKDMGPALVFSCVFLVLYGLARGSFFVPAAGLGLVTMGFMTGFAIGIPHTVRERVSMWLSPWNNVIHGGDQLADSLWSFATGGLAGMGIGRGDAQVVPAAHTDLILAALGEELGFLGVAAVFAVYAFLVWRALRIALRARSDYEFFLASGLAAATALQIFLIAGGALGVLPLSGVVTPFLSYGRSAMLANFAVIAILLAISGRAESAERAGDIRSIQADGADVPLERSHPFRMPVAAAATLFAACGAIVLAKAAYVQVARSTAFMTDGTLVIQADGYRRYQYNPRFQDVIQEIPKGT